MTGRMLRAAAGLFAALFLGACSPVEVSLTPSEQYERQGDEAYGAGDLEAAIEAYQQALAAGAKTIGLYNNLGNALFREKRFNAAEQSYIKALELDPEYMMSLNNLALTLYHAGEEEEAYRLIEKAMKNFPRSSFFHTTYGFFRYSDGDRAGAREAFARAVEINPDSPSALNNLGVFYLEEPQGGEDPLPYLKRAIEKDPTNLLFNDSLGWYYYQKGMFAEATIEIGKAFLYDPGNLEVRIHYASVLEWIGKDREALEQWEKVMNLTENGAIRKMALQHAWEIKGRGAGRPAAE